jgi:hypothetical protein
MLCAEPGSDHSGRTLFGEVPPLADYLPGRLPGVAVALSFTLGEL